MEIEMATSKVIEGFKVEVDGTDCFVSKGKFCTSLAAMLDSGILEDSSFTAYIDVPASVQAQAEAFAIANGW
jgi:hypothetical protein